MIGDEGRLEPTPVRLPAGRRLSIPNPQQDLHGGADRALVAEFLRFAAEGGPTDTSPIAAREAVAAAVAATTSLRSGGTPTAVPELDSALEGVDVADVVETGRRADVVVTACPSEVDAAQSGADGSSDPTCCWGTPAAGDASYAGEFRRQFRPRGTRTHDPATG